MDIKFEWVTLAEKEMFISLKSLVNKNGGYFKSANQVNYYKKHHFVCESRLCDNSPLTFLQKDQYKGCYYFFTEGTLNAAEWGSNYRRKGWCFVVDKFGVVSFYKLKFEYGKGKDRGWSGIDDGEELLFTRENSESKISALEEEQKEIQDKIKKSQDAKINREYVGNAGDKKCEFKGVINFVTSYENMYGTQYITTFRNEDDNTIKYSGKYLGERNCEISLIANIKKHEIYKDEKQTIIERPRNIECK